MSDCKHHNKIWYGVEGWDCENCPESGDLYGVVVDKLKEDTANAGVNCRQGCKTKDHYTYHECLSAASIGIDKTSLRP